MITGSTESIRMQHSTTSLPRITHGDCGVAPKHKRGPAIDSTSISRSPHRAIESRECSEKGELGDRKLITYCDWKTAVTQEQNYDSDRVRDYFDRLGHGEWERLQQSATSRIQARIHTHYLHRFFDRGDHVLDAGAGPGRFTIELARLGATVSVVDLSEEQLGLNRQKVAEAGLLDCVDGWHRADILDLGLFGDGTFDGTVCYGGGLSYVMERADDALEELLRVTKPGGFVAVSVSTVIGTARMSLPGFPGWIRRHGRDDLEHEMATGDALGTTNEGHWTHMYRWREFEELLLDHRCEIVAASAAGFMSIGNDDVVEQFEKDPDLYEWLLRWEIEYCREPGALDGGAQLIAVVRRDRSADRPDAV